MSNLLENDIVELEETGRYTWNIKNRNITVGKIWMDENHYLQFMIDEKYRQQHYASNALYVLTPFLHQTGMDDIAALIKNDNDMAKHVLEHNGYEKQHQDSEMSIYLHHVHHTRKDDDYDPEKYKVLYLAGGCFWGTQRIFQMLDGVVDTCTGYANGRTSNPCYEEICRSHTGFRETVRVTYDPVTVSVETILKAYFLCIDPTQINRQGNDIGEQYQTGIYYRDPSLYDEIAEVYETEKRKYEIFGVEFSPLECFYEAEEYHQNYLIKNPEGYCHITKADLDAVKALNHR